MNRPMFPPAIDSTILHAFRACPQKAKLSYVEHWKPSEESVHLVAGGAFAKGLEVSRRAFYEQGKSRSESEAFGLSALFNAYGDFECPTDSAKSAERTAGALEFYFSRYPFGEDTAVPIILPNGERGIEFSFAEPLPINHPTTGEPLLYTGRADMLCNYAGGIYIEDDKTTSSLGASWSKQWELRSQFTGYAWALRQLGIRPTGVLIRGVSILKTKYDTQEVLTDRPDWEIDRWFEQTIRDIRRMILMWEEGYWDYNLDGACAEYGGCQFQRICKTKNPEDWLSNYFHRRVWDPLGREEVTVENWEKRWTGKSNLINAG